MSNILFSKYINQREKDFIDFVYSLLEFDNLDELLKYIVEKAPNILNLKSCSIYLLPSIVKEFNGVLIKGNGQSIKSINLKKDFIVLAAPSSSRNLYNMIGKHFYLSGEGLTGWVFLNNKVLILNNLNDPQEFIKYRGLKWVNKYSGAEYIYDFSDKSVPFPFIGIPITIRGKCIGVIKFANTLNDSFSIKFPKEYFNSFSKVISKIIEIDKNNKDKKILFENFSKFNSDSWKKSANAFLKFIVFEIQRLFDSSICDIYTIDKFGISIVLKASSDRFSSKNIRKGSISFLRGIGLVGYIFKNGLPMVINNTVPFYNKKVMNESELLEIIWDNDSLVKDLKSDDERLIFAKNEEFHYLPNHYTRFLGVPILSKGKRVLGVISVLSKSNDKEFVLNDLNLLKTIANNISQFLFSQGRQKLKNLLIRIGRLDGEDLFQYVVKHLPKLLLSNACSIFLKSENTDEIELKYTNSQNFIDYMKRKDIIYKTGDGKTGLAYKLGRVLLINHYGEYNISESQIKSDYNKYSKNNFKPYNLIKILKNNYGRDIAIARLIREEHDPLFSELDKAMFNNFVEKTIYIEKGIPCSHEDSVCERGEDGYVKSFLAIPLKDRGGEIHGVMRIPRSFPGGVFTDEDLSIGIAVANRLSSVIERQKILYKDLTTLIKVNAKINLSWNLKNSDDILINILEIITDNLGFEFAGIQLVNEKNTEITTKMVMKNKNIADALDPNNWIGLSHEMDPKGGLKRDIHAWLLREHKKEIVIKGWHDNFDEFIYKKFDHENLIRVFMPISTHEKELDIGTIEAGYNIYRKHYIDNKQILILRFLSSIAAIALKNQRLKTIIDSKEAEIINSRQRSTLGLIASDLVHEISDPTQVILGNLQICERLIKTNKSSNEQILNDINLSIKNINHLVHICNNLYPITKKRELINEIISINSVIEDALLIYKYRLNSLGIIVKTEFKNSLPTFSADRFQIQSVFFNLLKNSKEALKNCENKLISISTNEIENYILVKFEDNGPGIPEEILKKLSKQNSSNKLNDLNSGIGLNLIYNIIKSYKGFISAKNKKLGGAEFIISIPFNSGE